MMAKRGREHGVLEPEVGKVFDDQDTGDQEEDVRDVLAGDQARGDPMHPQLLYADEQEEDDRGERSRSDADL
jgi:hypothetical protein